MLTLEQGRRGKKPACKLSSEGTRENFYWRTLRILGISLTHDQSCKIMCNHWRAGHRIGIETWTMWHSNTHRWNWGLIHGDVIQVRCSNYFFINFVDDEPTKPN